MDSYKYFFEILPSTKATSLDQFKSNTCKNLKFIKYWLLHFYIYPETVCQKSLLGNIIFLIPNLNHYVIYNILGELFIGFV